MAAEKKIVYLMGAWPVWSETFIQQELTLLLKAGLPLLPVAIFPGNQKISSDLPKVSILEGCKPQEAAVNGDKRREWTPVFVRRQAALIRHSSKINNLISRLQEDHIVHIHAAFAQLPGLLASAVSRKLGVPYSVSVHAHDAVCRKYDDRYIFERADFIYGCNRRVLSVLAERSPWLIDQLEYVPHGLQPADWPMRDFRPPGNPLEFLFVGRLVEKKAPLAAQHLVDALSEAGVRAHITFVGDGPLSGQVSTRGVLTRGEVGELMRQSDFLLNTSRELEDGDMEGVPNVILEAMASGLPVLAPATGGIDEVLNHETGFVIDPNDPAAFCSIIQRILAAPSILKPKVAKARAVVEGCYQVESSLKTKIARFQTYLSQSDSQT